MTFQVGDVVEVINCTKPENAHWIGRVVVVACYGEFNPLSGTIGVFTVPHPTRQGPFGWNPNHLRRITPPDWSAPLTTELERERSGV